MKIIVGLSLKDSSAIKTITGPTLKDSSTIVIVAELSLKDISAMKTIAELTQRDILAMKCLATPHYDLPTHQRCGHESPKLVPLHLFIYSTMNVINSTSLSTLCPSLTLISTAEP